MNLFDIISGNRNLQEEHVTAVLAWLLDPSQSHGCGTMFLKNILSLLDENEFNPYLSERSLVDIHKKSDSSIHVLMEQNVKSSNGDRRIDIVISLKCEDKPTHIVAIENKIKNGSIDKNQLIDEYEGLKDSSDDDVVISFIYLVPKVSSPSQEAFEKLPESILKFHLPWKGDKSKSFVGILISALEKESKGLISPFSYETKFIIKSFVQFILGDFVTPIQKYNQNPTDYIKNYNGKLNGLEALREYTKTHPEIYVGYTGGKAKLKTDSLENLINRKYKYNTTLDAPGITKRNWLLASEFFTIVKDVE